MAAGRERRVMEEGGGTWGEGCGRRGEGCWVGRLSKVVQSLVLARVIQIGLWEREPVLFGAFGGVVDV